jgi:interferon gamma-inducible protein 30
MQVFFFVLLSIVLSSAHEVAKDLLIQTQPQAEAEFQAQEKADLVDVKVFYEGLCPGCAEFIRNALKSFWKAPDLRAIIHLSLYPCGNANCSKWHNHYTCSCQHGRTECVSNQLMACVIDRYPKVERYLPFVFCFDGHSNVVERGKKCLKHHNMPESLLTCAQGFDGVKLQYEMWKQTPSTHKYVPWVLINGKHAHVNENHFQKAVCDAYGGPKPASCTNEAQKEFVEKCKMDI